MWFESRLSEAPLEGRKIRGFHAGLDNNEQSESSYRLPIGDALADILANIDDRFPSTTSGVQSKKVSKLLPILALTAVNSSNLRGRRW